MTVPRARGIPVFQTYVTCNASVYYLAHATQYRGGFAKSVHRRTHSCVDILYTSNTCGIYIYTYTLCNRSGYYSLRRTFFDRPNRFPMTKIRCGSFLFASNSTRYFVRKLISRIFTPCTINLGESGRKPKRKPAFVRSPLFVLSYCIAGRDIDSNYFLLIKILWNCIKIHPEHTYTHIYI